MKMPNLTTDSALTVNGGLGTDQFKQFLNSTQKWIRDNGGTIYGTSAQRTTPTTRGYQDPQNIAGGTLYVETDTGLIYQLRSTPAAGNTGGAQARSATWVCIWGTQIIQQTLTVAGPTNIDAPTSGALRLLYVLDQDATGGRAIHWHTGFTYASDSLGNMAASSRSIFEFALYSGSYIPVGQPLTDLL